MIVFFLFLIVMLLCIIVKNIEILGNILKKEENETE